MAQIRIDKKMFAEITKSDPVQAELKKRADEAAVYARSIAPVETGAYRDSIEVVAVDYPERSGWRLQATDYKAVWVEYGTETLPAHAVFEKTRDHVEGGGG